MTSGGARNNSGPTSDPNSIRSKNRGIKLTELPAEGYFGEIPDFPLPKMDVRRWEFEEKRRFQVVDDEMTATFRLRELALWAEAWTWPQGEWWASEPWRQYGVAMWVRTAVVCEGSEATAADKGSIHRFADQIALTPAGLRENGLTIAARIEVEADPADSAAPDAPVVDMNSARGRLRK